MVVEVFVTVIRSLLAGLNRKRISLLRYTLLFIWCVGLFLGFLFASSAEATIRYMRCASAFRGASIIALFLSQILPLLISIIAIRFRLKSFGYFIILLKSFLLGFFHCITLFIFGSAAWLVKFLLSFSESVNIIILLYLWITKIDYTGRWYFKKSISIIIAAAFVCYIDIRFIAPYSILLIV